MVEANKVETAIKETNTSTEAILALREIPGGGELQTAVWYSDFARVKAEAERTGKALFAMWINPGCGFCKRFCADSLSSGFLDWMDASDMLFWLGSRTDDDRGSDGYEFVFQQSESGDIKPEQRGYFPGIAVWQCAAGHPDQVLHDYRASGRVFAQEKTGPQAVENITARIRAALVEPPHPKYVRKEQPTDKTAPKPGGCPGNHPHLAALQEISKIIERFVPRPKPVTAQSNLRIRLNPAMPLDKRTRFLQSLAEHNGLCPCQPAGGAATACLCAAFMAQDKPGVCKCGFYEKYIPGKEG